MSSDKESFPSPPKAPRPSYAKLQPQPSPHHVPERPATPEYDTTSPLLSATFRPPITPSSSFPKPQLPASVSPSSPHFGKQMALRRRRTMPEVASGLRSVRDSTPVPDDILEDGEVGDEMELDKRPVSRHYQARDSMDIDERPSPRPHEPSSPSPTSAPLPSIEPASTSEPRPRSKSRVSPPSSGSSTPSLVHSVDEYIMSTEYIAIPPSQSIAVLDESQLHTQSEWYTGGPRSLVKGSNRGKYLDDFNEDLKLQMKDIINEEWEKPAHLRNHKNLLKTYDTSARWDQKFATRCDAESSSCTWMNETWGPPIDNPLGLQAKSRSSIGHPSATLRLNAQYGGDSPTSSKRPSIDSGVTGSPGKKPKLILTVRPPVKEHKKFTAPQMERESPGHQLLSPKPSPPRRPTICSNCKAHEDDTPLYLCDKCDQNAYCSRRCETKFAPLHVLTCKPGTPQSPQDADISKPSIMNDPRNYIADESIVMTTEATKSPSPPPLRPREILAFRVTNSRTMEYRVAGHSGSLWQSAESLRGDMWTVAMDDFWQSTPRNKLWRRFAERPPIYYLDTGQMGRSVTAMLLEDERSLAFDVRDFDDTVEDDWRTAEELGAE